MASKKMMVPMDSPEDSSERMMGAMSYLRKKYGNKFSTEGYKSPREFIASAKDVISESDISDMYPENVWSKAADKLLMGVWSKRKMKITRK